MLELELGSILPRNEERIIQHGAALLRHDAWQNEGMLLIAFVDQAGIPSESNSSGKNR